MSKYEVKLQGKQARLGEVAAVDVAHLILDVQTLIARAAGAAIGRRPKATGRWEGAIEEATKLRLVDVKRGSVLVEMKPPDADPSVGELELPLESLADLGWSTATDALNRLGRGDEDPDVLVRLLRLADDLSIGQRFDVVEFRTDGEPVARLDREAREVLRSTVGRMASVSLPPPAVNGVLFEADFERHTARVRTQDGNVVDLLFDEEQSGTIKEALRERSQFLGDVTFDPITHSVRAVRLRRISRFEQLLLGEEDAQAFWDPLSFDQLALDQQSEPIASFDDLRDESLSDEDYERFVEAFR